MKKLNNKGFLMVETVIVSVFVLAIFLPLHFSGVLEKIDTPEKLYPLYLQLKERFQCIYHKDIYSGEQWLEIQPAKANKANAVLLLKEYLHCEKVVCFGDALNDLSMFHVCDECYAVENAVEELKSIATATIAIEGLAGSSVETLTAPRTTIG